MNNLGLLYQHGLGVDEDYDKAREWYQKAAKEDDADAMCNLGWLYQYGLGVDQDYGQARELYKKAADAGVSEAKDNLKRLDVNSHEANASAGLSDTPMPSPSASTPNQ